VRAALVLVLLLACKSDKPAPAPAPASGTAVAPAPADAAAPAAPDTCKLGAAAIDGATCPTPEVRATLVAMKKSLDGVVQTVGQAAADPQQFSVMCAQLLLAIERDAKKQGCTLALPDDKRAEMMSVLDAWYARRTPVTPTGDAAADAIIAKIAAVRDATCECKDGACLESLTKKLAGVGEMPATAPQAARDLGSALLGDAARCANRVRTITDPVP
jgi:hypothetical protein